MGKHATLILVALIACGAGPVSCAEKSIRLTATQCFVVSGDRTRFRELDGLARSVADDRGFKATGATSALVIVANDQEVSRIGMTSPFGEFVSIVSLFEHGPEDKKLKSLFNEIISKFQNEGFSSKPCKDVVELDMPVTWVGAASKEPGDE